MKEIYCDNAATSFPKPPEVLRAIEEYTKNLGASAGRGAYPRALAAGEELGISFDLKNIADEEIKQTITRNIKSVDGDFRQAKIFKKWDKFFTSNIIKQFTVAKFRISCSSGTYVRSLANELGKIVGTGAIALEILRTKVGNYTLDKSFRGL